MTARDWIDGSKKFLGIPKKFPLVHIYALIKVAPFANGFFMTAKLKLLLIQCDHANPYVHARFGDMNHHFERAFAPVKNTMELTSYPLVDLWSKEPCPDPKQFHGVIMSGSASMVSDPLGWIPVGKQLISYILEAEIPFLGVCFGHQMLANTCGAKVGPNPYGRMQGTGTFKQHPNKDPLFSQLPETMKVQLSHRDVILEPSKSMAVLGQIDHDPFHAIKVGNIAYGVQFHPEWDKAMSEAYLTYRRAILTTELGEERVQKMQESLTDSENSQSLLIKFADLCAG